MMIAIDHGNKQIKSANNTFISGVVEKDSRPFGKNILLYKAKYYLLSEQRIPYMRDKTEDEKFFIMTLIAIAEEINTLGLYTDESIMDIQLIIGLPPAHYGALYERFEAYFKRKEVIDFEYQDKPYSILIDDVCSFPQAYTATMSIYSQIKHLPKAMVIDIGGFTADYLQLKKGNADLSVCDSLENGVISFYHLVQSKINAEYDILLDEADIDLIINNEETDFNVDIISHVHLIAQNFINNLVGILRERMIDLRSCKTIFVGGGSILLRGYIEKCEKIGSALFVDEISANVKGYEYLYKAMRKNGR